MQKSDTTTPHHSGTAKQPRITHPQQRRDARVDGTPWASVKAGKLCKGAVQEVNLFSHGLVPRRRQQSAVNGSCKCARAVLKCTCVCVCVCVCVYTQARMWQVRCCVLVFGWTVLCRESRVAQKKPVFYDPLWCLIRTRTWTLRPSATLQLKGIHWATGLFLRTPFTEGCAGANKKASPPWPSSGTGV